MENIQTINVSETAKLSKAIKSGKPFYIADKGDKMLAYDPELELAEQRLTTLLQEAEACKERCGVDEFWAYVDKV
jgi:hypothetical protein